MASTRDRILDAAADVMRELGLARTTTKEIARAAGCSEGLLYKHFRSKEELFLGVLHERTAGSFTARLAALAERAGRGTVRGNLTELARAAIDFYEDSFPRAASVFSEPQLLTSHREWLREHGVGPHLVNVPLAGYLRAERELGRVEQGVDPDAAAALLFGGCLQYAFFSALTSPDRSAETYVEGLVSTLLDGIADTPGA
ncbi:TetR/AcrR family transcriptional regulator [Streptosporangium sp. NPDC051023]|uniref:TetR/AcrR family transcriptional regulator n=1 Tax=Streptosporangium sp. NPDC051023 TaxID=3155410 RepID=UPI00344B10FF